MKRHITMQRLALISLSCAAMCFAAACSDDDSETLDFGDCPPSQCSNHGTCTVEELRPFCACDDGYAGATCGRCDDGFHRNAADACVPDETCADDSCAANGTCVVDAGVVLCNCERGWAGDTCAICAPGFHDEEGSCVLDGQCLPTTCAGNGDCADAGGQLSCDCDEGFSGDFCETAPPPESCPAEDPCGDHGTCEDAGGLVRCLCDPGYLGDACDTCYPGYADDGEGGCVLADSCLPSTCLGFGTCMLIHGRATCDCNDGYAGEACQDCAEGFHRGEGLLCVADQSCEGDTSCGDDATCDDSSGAIRCLCNDGYAGATCNNCYPGYHRDEAGDCVLDERCGATTCINGGSCEDASGVVECTCADGFEGDRCEIDADDCVNHACGAGVCLDLVDDRVCRCPDGSYGDSCPE